MLEDFGKQLFDVLQKDAVTRLGPDHLCSLALSQAIKTGNQSDVLQAQQQLSALPDHVQKTMMKAAHKAMREDPAALLEMWNGSPKDRAS